MRHEPVIRNKLRFYTNIFGYYPQFVCDRIAAIIYVQIKNVNQKNEVLTNLKRQIMQLSRRFVGKIIKNTQILQDGQN